MGNIITSQSHRFRHEKLNEHNERYFEKVHARNSLNHSRRQWRRKKRHQKFDAEATAWTEACNTSLERDDGTESPKNTPPVEGIVLATPSSPKLQQDHHHHIRTLQINSIDPWQDKRKGKALRMRLAKNRFLQLATSEVTSPITLGSEFASKTKLEPIDTLAADEMGDLNSKFDSIASNGLIWAEISRVTKVTAIAMSRPSEDPTDTLLLAVGTENGVVTLTEILDERSHLSPIACASSVGSMTADSSHRKLGETLECILNGRIRSLDISADRNYLVAGGDDCTAVILRILKKHSKALLSLHIVQKLERIDRVYAVQFSPKSNFLAIAGFDGKVAITPSDCLFSCNNSSFVEIERSGLLFCIDWSSDGTYLAVGSSDKRCTILDDQFNVVHVTYPRPTSIQAVKWNPTSTLLAIGDREVAIMEASTFCIKYEISNAGLVSDDSRYRISSLCWSPDGTYLAVGGSDGCCLVAETKGYTLVHEIRRDGIISCLAWGEQKLANNEIRRYLGMCDDSCNIALLKAGAELEGSVSDRDDLSSAASSSNMSRGGVWILREDSFRDMDDATKEPPRGLEPQGNITAVAFSRASKTKLSAYLAYSADDCSLSILTTTDWKAVFQMEFAKPVRAMAFSNSNNYLAVGGDEGVLYVLSVPSRSMILNTIMNAPISTVSFSRLDERLAVGSKDGMVALLCPNANWEPVAEIEHSESAVLAKDWSTRNLAIGRADGSVSIFETEKVFSNFFVPQAELAHASPTTSVTFGASGRFLAVGCENGKVGIYSAKGDWVLCHQIEMASSVLASSWSPTGRYLAYAGRNKVGRIVDTITWAEVKEVRESVSQMFGLDTDDYISSVTWSVDGKWVAFGSTGGGVHVLVSSDWQILAPCMDKLNIACGSFAGRDSPSS